MQRVLRWSGWRADLLALLAGALSALALPPVHAIPVLGLTLPLLLLQIEQTSWKGALRRGFAFGMGLNTAGLYWLTNAVLQRADQFWWLVPFVAPLTAIPLAIVLMLPAVAPALLGRFGLGDRFSRLLVFAGAWEVSDLFRSVAFTGFPWNLFGSVWEIPGRVGDVMIQLAAWIGVDGLTLVTVFLAGLVLAGRRGWVAIAAVLVVWAGAGAWRLRSDAPPAADAPLAVLVQGNVAESEKLDRAAMVGIFRNYLTLTKAGIAKVPAGRTSVVAWPETAFPGLLAVDVPAREMIAQAAHGAQAMLIGSVRYDDKERPRNSVIALDPQGEVTATYDKAHLVPFGEYQPHGLPIQIVPGGGFAAGPGPRTLDLPGIPEVGMLVCYEVIFPGEVVEPGHRPAWLLNVTNDAWYGNSAGPRQHLATTRMRAVEEGLPLARDANTGITAMYDAYGHELGRLGWGVAGSLVAPVGKPLPPTVFARFGVKVPLVMALFVIALGIARAGRRRHAVLLSENVSKT